MIGSFLARFFIESFRIQQGWSIPQGFEIGPPVQLLLRSFVLEYSQSDVLPGLKKIWSYIFTNFFIQNKFSGSEVSEGHDWRRQTVSGGDSSGLQAGLEGHETMDAECRQNFE